MTLTNIKSKPLLRGTLAAAGPWQGLFAHASLRIYPFHIGCAVRLDSVTTSVYTSGLGEFLQNDYFIVCRPAYYGDSPLYVPQTSMISRVTSDPLAAVDDLLTISPALTLFQGDWLLNLGADTAANPLIAPNYDGSRIALYTDPVGNDAAGTDYMLTGQGGGFQGWIADGYAIVDLLITNPSGVPTLAIPSVPPGPGVVS